MRNTKIKTKTEKGITLIALIITIVVLLILAVVAINSIQNVGIISKAEEAAKKYNEAVQNEADQLQNYLDYLDKVNGGSSTTNPEDEPTQGTTYVPYTVGQTVKVVKDGVEHFFYVIEDSNSTKETVLLLTKENIGQSTTFSSTNYWYTEGATLTYPYNLTEQGQPDENKYALRAAYDYGNAIGAKGPGRLMNYTEANTLKADTNFSSKLYETCFWLGYATSNGGVGCVFGAYSGVEEVTGYDYAGIGPGIRSSPSS